MVAWPVVVVSGIGVVFGLFALYRYAWQEPEAMRPTGSPGRVLRALGIYDSALARRILIGFLGGLLVLVGLVVAWLGLLIE